MNHVVLCWASGCESVCVILRQWLWIMVYYSLPMVVNYVLLFWASGFESWWVMLSQWLWIMVCYSEPVVVNHGVLCWASGCESWWAIIEFNIRLYDKNSESDYFYFLHQIENIFFSNIGNQNIFLEKKYTPPPPPLQVKWSFPYSLSRGRSVVFSWHSWHQK